MADNEQMASRSRPQKPRPWRLGSKMKFERGRNENTTPFDPSPNHCTFEIYGLSSAQFQVRRPVGAVVRGARCGVVREGRTEERWRLYEGWLRRI
ncbi:hypothetical protein ES319_A06G210600v1 [Gossypium barbadense]|uniref:Uncharacterized protein n=1 Tax=Gossypium barbadense TaxID=3634 RepID=A0A5J5VH78_GOSBA|nr:hypothetical protein ES319_A06G210600v1 [Gossypium barbadense]